MRLSLEWLRDYVEIPESLSIRQIAHDLTMRTVEVEGAIELARTLDAVVVAEIAEIADSAQPGRRTLLCDLGDHRIPVISTVQELRVGQHVALALPGARLRGPGDGEGIVVVAREFEGLRSEGVLCSAEQLGLAALFPDSTGVLMPEAKVAPGTSLAVAVGWDDTILEIDNKSLTNRPDLWGHYGIARELAAIYRLPLKPLPAMPDPGEPLSLIDPGFDTAVCRRFFAAKIAFDAAPTSPFWLRSRLARVGQASRGLAVDLTNYVMFSIGQPCHAYDARKLRLPLSVRRAHEGEQVSLLDGKDYPLQPSMPVITDAGDCVAVAGVMGGAATAVGEATNEIVLEMANFDPLSVRRMATALGLRTEASSRFEKAIDTARVDAGRAVFFDLLRRTCADARVLGSQDLHPRPTPALTVDADIGFLQRRLGIPMPEAQIRGLLESVGFSVQAEGSILRVGVPSWRATGDVSLPEDVLEEVARLHGYENFEYVEPRVALRRVPAPERRPLDHRLRLLCAGVGGLQEVVSYPWAADLALEAAGLADAVQLALSTPPSPDRRWLRPSLVPGLIERVAENLRFAQSFGLFEIGSVFPRGEAAPLTDPREALPRISRRLAAVLVGGDVEAAFVAAKGLIAQIGHGLGAPLHFDRGDGPVWGDPGAYLRILCGEAEVGHIAVLHARARRIADIKRALPVAFELCIDLLPKAGDTAAAYQPLPLYPESFIDLSMIFREQTAWGEIEASLHGLHPLIRAVEFVDLFRGRGIPPEHKSVTLRLRLGRNDGTLRSEEAAEVSALAEARLMQAFEARGRQAETAG